MYHFSSLWYDLTGYRAPTYPVQSEHCTTGPRAWSWTACGYGITTRNSDSVYTCNSAGKAISLKSHTLNSQVMLFNVGAFPGAERATSFRRKTREVKMIGL